MQGMRWDSGRGAERGGGCGGTAGWEMQQQQRDPGMERGVRRGDAAAVGPRDESGARLLPPLLLLLLWESGSPNLRAELSLLRQPAGIGRGAREGHGGVGGR